MLVQELPKTNAIRASFYVVRPSYEEAKSILKGHASSQKQYHTFRANNPQFNLPANPHTYYKNKGWVDSYDFFGTVRKSAGCYLKAYWTDVKTGKRVHKPKKKSAPVTESKQTPIKVAVKSTTTLEDKQTFIALAKKLGVYDNFRPAFKTLFTYEELLDMINL
jgi:hypothetical protein